MLSRAGFPHVCREVRGSYAAPAYSPPPQQQGAKLCLRSGLFRRDLMQHCPPVGDSLFWAVDPKILGVGMCCQYMSGHSLMYLLRHINLPHHLLQLRRCCQTMLTVLCLPASWTCSA
eukprot:1730056-Amphidinium_carterae.2